MGAYYALCGRPPEESEDGRDGQPEQFAFAEPADEETPAAEIPAEAPPFEEALFPETFEEPPYAPAPPASDRPAAKRKEPVWLFVVLGVVAAAAIVILIFSLSQGGKKNADSPADKPSDAAVQTETPNGETDSGPSADSDAPAPAETKTYTVPNEEITAEMASAAAASCGQRELSNTELSYYYWNQFYSWANAYGDYLSYFLDVNTPLSEQSYPDDPERSWEDFLLDAALETFQQTAAIVEAAEEAGFELDKENAEYLSSLPDTLAGNAELMEMDSADAFLQNLYGPYADVESYTRFVRDSLVSYGYLNEVFAGIEYGPEEVGAWFDENQSYFEDMGLSKDEPNLVNVRHILIKPEETESGEDGGTEITDQAWADARKRAEDLLKEWESGEATEDSFAVLASENTEDPGSQGTGGLYEGVYPGEMVTAFNDWCFDESRKPGDTGIVETEYGYHIMYFSAVQDHAHWYEMAEQDYLASRQQEVLDDLTADHPLQANYDSIVLMESKALH